MRPVLAALSLLLVAGACDSEDDSPSPAEATCERVYGEHVELIQQAAAAARAGAVERMYSYSDADAQLIVGNQPCFDDETVREAQVHIENLLAGLGR